MFLLFFIILDSNALKIVLTSIVIFSKYLRNYIQYLVSKILGRANFENKARNTDVY